MMFIIGFILGGVFGISLMCLMAIAKDADEKLV